MVTPEDARKRCDEAMRLSLEGSSALWAEVMRLGYDNAIVRNCLDTQEHLCRRADTRVGDEHMLLVMVLQLAQANQTLHAEMVNIINRWPPNPLVLPT